MENRVKFEKVPLNEFINVLISLWEDGANYVDISAKKSSDRDVIHITVKPEYIDDSEEEYEDEDDEEDEVVDKNKERKFPRGGTLSLEINPSKLKESDLEKLSDL
jgi:DNA-binding protein YbaB